MKSASCARCPPGHGDIYPSLLGSGMLDRLIDGGIKYLFVSNSDNLGATLDLDLLEYFAKSGKDFVMEVSSHGVVKVLRGSMVFCCLNLDAVQCIAYSGSSHIILLAFSNRLDCICLSNCSDNHMPVVVVARIIILPK